MGEFELLAALRERLPPPGPGVVLGSGDDAAITAPAGATATSVDSIVEGVHFTRPEFTLGEIGHKALACALSDLAAMGAAPGEAYVAVGVPQDMSQDDLLELFAGLTALAALTETTIAGGDVSASPVLSLAVTVVGHAVVPELFARRSGARPGDLLLLTGALGGAAAGLRLLRDPALAASLDEPSAQRLRSRQTTPEARLATGSALARGGATAMIDISDGLGADAGHLAAASGAGLTFETEAIPVCEGVAAVAEAAGIDPLDLVLGGGEDYELLAAVPPDRAEEAVAALSAPELAVTVVGAVRAGEGVEFRLPGGGAVPSPPGHDQLRRSTQPS